MDQEQLLGTNYISHRKYNEIFKLYNLHLYVILAIGILRFFFPVVIVFFQLRIWHKTTETYNNSLDQ